MYNDQYTVKIPNDLPIKKSLEAIIKELAYYRKECVTLEVKNDIERVKRSISTGMRSIEIYMRWCDIPNHAPFDMLAENAIQHINNEPSPTQKLALAKFKNLHLNRIKEMGKAIQRLDIRTAA